MDRHSPFRVVSLFLAVTMLVAPLPVHAYAQGDDEFIGDELTYQAPGEEEETDLVLDLSDGFSDDDPESMTVPDADSFDTMNNSVARQAFGQGVSEFNDNVLIYQVLSEEDKTVSVSGLTYDYITNNGSAYITIPATVSCGDVEYSVTGIAKNCLFKSEITGATLPDSLEWIGEGAFWACANLQSVNIPPLVKEIPAMAFEGCESLENITFSDSSILSYIGDTAFAGCSSLADITLPGTVSEIGNGVFSGCSSLESLIIPDAVTRLGMFYGCESLREVILPASLVFINTEQLFWECPSLESISIADGDTKFYTENGVLYGRYDFKEVDKYGNVISSREMLGLIKYPAAKSGPFTIPEGVEVISEYAFYCAKATSQITVPASVRHVMKGAFSETSTEVESITITFLSEIPPEFAISGIFGSDGNSTIYVPTTECIEAYKKAMGNRPGGKVSFGVTPTGGENNPDGNDPDGNDPDGNNPDGNDPGGNDPGGNGSGNNTRSGSGGGTDYTSSQTTSDYRSLEGLLRDSIKAANDAGSKTATLRLVNYLSLDLGTLAQLAATAKASDKTCMLNADTVVNGSVLVRLTFNPANAAKDILLKGFVDSTGVQYIKALFERYFQNRIIVVELAQQGDFGMTVIVAAKVDLTGFDTKTLYFYSYDEATNTYFRITNPLYFIDKNGYLHFNTQRAGYIIIADKPLVLK